MTAAAFTILIAGLICAACATDPPAPADDEPARLGYLWDARFKGHVPGEGHPESPARLDAVQSAVARSSLDRRVKPIVPRLCEDRWVLAVHGEDYLAIVNDTIARGQSMLPTGDTQVSAESMFAARLAAGGVLEACDSVMSGDVANAFCAVRPPGHHATSDRGMGFCILNNLAIAARYLRLRHGVQRILIVDWDVHHGNGTYDIFKDDPHVFQFHLHQEGIYPGTGGVEDVGEGAGKGLTINNPLPAGAGIEEFTRLFARKLLPAMEVFRPRFILISAGFDAHRDDPLGGLALTADDYARLTHVLCDIADLYCDGRIVSVLEGGYNLAALGESVVAHMRVLAERAGRSGTNDVMAPDGVAAGRMDIPAPPSPVSQTGRANQRRHP